MPGRDFTLVMKPSAREGLLALAVQVIVRVQRHLNRTPECYRASQPAPDVRQIEGRPHTFRLKSGVYRTIFEVDATANFLRVFRIGHRRDVYRNI